MRFHQINFLFEKNPILVYDILNPIGESYVARPHY